MSLDDRKTLMRMEKEYYEKNFKKPKEEVDIFIEKQLKKGMRKTLEATLRFFLLESALYKYKSKDKKQEKILENLHSISDGFDFIMEKFYKIML